MSAPKRIASRGEWDEYAQSLGLDPDDYATKDDLIEAVEALDQPGGTEAPEEDAPQLGFSELSDHPGWKKAFSYAQKKGNPDKTAALYANSHFGDDEFNG